MGSNGPPIPFAEMRAALSGFAGERVTYSDDGVHLDLYRIDGPVRYFPNPLDVYRRHILSQHADCFEAYDSNAIGFHDALSDRKELVTRCFSAVRLFLEGEAEEDNDLAEWALNAKELHGGWADEMAGELARITAPAIDRTRQASTILTAAAEVVQAWLSEQLNGADHTFQARLPADEIPGWHEIADAYQKAAELDEDGLPLALSDVLADAIWSEEDREGIRTTRLIFHHHHDSGLPPYTVHAHVWAWLASLRTPTGEETSTLLSTLAWKLWADRWKGQADRHKDKVAALIGPVYAVLGTALRVLPLPAIHADSRQLSIPGLRPVLSVQASAFRAALEGALKVSPVLAHRTIRSLVRWGTLAHNVGEEGPAVILFTDPRGEVKANRTASGVDIVVTRGGFDLLSTAVGHNSKSHSPRDILDVLGSHGAAWDGLDGIGGRSTLLNWHSDDGQRIVIHLGVLLMPGVAGSKSIRLKSHEKVLITTLPVPSLEGIGGRSHKALCNLDWAATGAFVNGRGELATHGGVALNWESLARTAGITSRSQVLAKALDLWVARGDDALDPRERKPTARWVETSPGRYSLVDYGAEGAALLFILNGAKEAKRGSERGKRSARLRKKR